MRKGLVILGVVLLLLGLAALLHPNITYSKRDEVMKVGPIQATVEKQENVQVPVGVAALLLIAGIGLVVIGAQVKR
ncbi:MAG: DUF3185 domain-containing protein [Acidobacteriia bacterium]|jgi:uncharacterized membrane protein HdeD (DUF308 family)|nr:DUF3185 domain-containing protein [Terriglobia bacterium]